MDAEEDEQFNLEEVRFGQSSEKNWSQRLQFLLKVLNDTTCTNSDTCKKQKEEVHLFLDRDGFYSLYVFEAGSIA